MDLARGEAFAHDFKEGFQQAGYLPGCPPATLIELALLARLAEPDTAGQAEQALRRMRQWGLESWSLPPVSGPIAAAFQQRLARLGLLPFEERTDGIILAQTALLGIPVLVTSDHHLLDIPEDDLRRALQDADLPEVTVLSPRRLARLQPGG
jgi:hypothetical protein